MNKKQRMNIIYLFLLFYFLINVFFLTRFPFIHSDESWLSGLSRDIMVSKNIFTTELFFDIYPRFPHAIKIFFHILQMPFIIIFGYTVFSARLLSLIFSIFSLFLFYKILYQKTNNCFHSILPTILFSLNIQYIYASHFARQEIIILFLMLLGLLVYLNPGYFKQKQPFILGSIIGIGIGIHPNSFLLALIFGFLYLTDCVFLRKPLKQLLFLVLTTTSYALFFILLSFLGDKNFIKHYKSYGSTLGVDLSFITKFRGLKDFYLKLYHSISGTYYVPNMKYFWIIFIIIVLISLVVLIFSLKTKKDISLIRISIVSLFSIHLGIILIGRYNASSIVFIVPFFYFMLHFLLQFFFKKQTKIMVICYLFLIVSTLFLSFIEMKPYLQGNYENYLNEFLGKIPPNAKTLGNLNAGFYFEPNALLDYRNLAYLEKNQLRFEDYVVKNNIEYIVYYEELDYIHNNPQWNVLYGKDNYYNELQEFTQSNCTLIHSFHDSFYGIRITRYMMDYDWEILIYKVN